MKLHRSEIVFIGYLTMLVVASVLAFVAADKWATIAGSIDSEASIAQEIQVALVFENAVWMVLVVALIFGVVGLYPVIRESAREHGRLSEVTQHLAKKTETFQQAALTDALTGLQNRRYFDDALVHYLDQFSAIGLPVGLIAMDLDHFKKVNDTYGHDVGDAVLRGVTKCLLDYTRFHDVVARMGGEEFSILAPNLDQVALQRLADRIRVAISEITFESDNVRFRVTTSMGVTLWDGSESAAAFLKRADRNLYRAKTTGRNRAVA